MYRSHSYVGATSYDQLFEEAYKYAISSINSRCDSKKHEPTFQYSLFDKHVINYLEKKYYDWFYKRNELNTIYISEIKLNPMKGVIKLLKEVINYETPEPVSSTMLYDLAKIYAAYSHPELSEDEKISLLYTPLTYEDLGEDVAGSTIIDYKFGYHISINPKIMNILNNDEKLEVYLHELKHIIQYYKGESWIHHHDYLEGEATYYAKEMVKALNPNYESIASVEYQQYVEKYARRSGKDVLVVKPYVEEIIREHNKSKENNYEESSTFILHPPYYEYIPIAGKKDDELIPKGYLH